MAANTCFFHNQRWRIFWRQPLLRLFLIIVLAELLIFQWAAYVPMPTDAIEMPIGSWAMEGLQPSERANHVLTAEKVESHAIIIRVPDINLRSVYLDAYSDRSGPLVYQVLAVTESSSIPQNMAAGEIVSGIERSRSLLFRPQSEVSQLRLQFELEPGERLFLNRLVVNRKIPFTPSLLRIVLLFIGGLCLFLLLKAPVFLRQAMPDDFGQRLITTLTAAFIVILCFWLAIASASEPFFAVSETGGDFYSRDFADALRRGRFDLLITPPQELAESANPYDPALREAIVSSDLIEDAAYYNGRYYVPYGIVPALLLFAPFRQLYGYTFQTIWAVTLFGAFAMLLLYLNIRRLLLIYFPHLAFRWHYVAGLSTCAASFIGWGLTSPGYENMSRLGGLFFVLMASNQLLYLVYGRQGLPRRSLIREAVLETQADIPSIERSDRIAPVSSTLPENDTLNHVGRISCGRLLLTGLFIMLAIGCHPVQAIILLPYTLVFFLLIKRAYKNKQLFPALVCFILPVLIGGFLLGSYNQARFGSVFEFGGRFRLTFADLRFTTINLARLFPGLGQHLLTPPIISPVFPFIHFPAGAAFMPATFFPYDGRTIGLVTLPFLLILPLFPLQKKLRVYLCRATSTQQGVLLGSVLTGLIIAAHNSLMRGAISGNTIDFAVWFALAAAILWLIFAEQIRQGTVDNLGLSADFHNYAVNYPQTGDNWFAFFLVAGVLTITICGLLFLQGEADNIRHNMPQLYEQLRRLTAFWLP